MQKDYEVWNYLEHLVEVTSIFSGKINYIYPGAILVQHPSSSLMPHAAGVNAQHIVNNVTNEGDFPHDFDIRDCMVGTKLLRGKQKQKSHFRFRNAYKEWPYIL